MPPCVAAKHRQVDENERSVTVDRIECGRWRPDNGRWNGREHAMAIVVCSCDSVRNTGIFGGDFCEHSAWPVSAESVDLKIELGIAWNAMHAAAVSCVVS